MLKTLQTRLQQYLNWEIPRVHAGLRKGRGTRDQIANICWIIEKAREIQKNIYFCFIDYVKDFDYLDHIKLCNILFFSFNFISWRLITLQYCSGFCHTLTWISHGFTCIPHPDPPSQYSQRDGNTRDLTCLSRNLYAGQEAMVRTGHRTTDRFKIGKGCILSSCLFNLYAEYIMRNAGVDEAQTGIKIAGRKINNPR